MERLNKDLKKQLGLALAFTFALPVGGVMLGVGLGFGVPAVWGVGIAFLAAGFYGCPIAWTSGYVVTKGLERIVQAVTNEHLYTVDEIAEQTGQKPRFVRAKLDVCFKRQYLVGFKRNGDNILANFNTDILTRVESAECAACGAKFTYTPTDPRCPYCGTRVN